MNKKIRRRLTALAIAWACSLGAVEVEITSSVYKTDENNILAFEQYLKEEKNFRAESRKDLEKNLREDWILAEVYVQNNFNDYEKSKLTNMVNRYLAKEQIKKIQKKIDISEDVVKSYYLDHLDNYKLKPYVEMKIFNFDTLESAHAFYIFTQSHTYDESLQHAVKEDIAYVQYNNPFNRMMPEMRHSLRDMKQKNYFTPPQLYKKQYMVTYIENITEREGYVAFEKTRKYIKKLLWKKTYLKQRSDLLSQYEAKQ